MDLVDSGRHFFTTVGTKYRMENSGMRKNACEAILADRPDRETRGDPRAAAEVEGLRADKEERQAA